MRIRVIDLETTGFEPTAHVVEIAAWDLFHKDGVIVPVGAKLVKPPVSIPPEVSAVHHITDEDVANEAPWAEVYPQFIDDDVDAYCAHRAVFEQQWLTGELTHGKPWICTMRCAYRLYADAPSFSNQALRYFLKPSGLDRTIAAVAHRAAPDAYVTAHILNLMFHAPKVDLAGLITVSGMIGLQPRITFGKHYGKKWAEIDADYLDWMLGQNDMDDEAKAAARRELARRRSRRQEEEARCAPQAAENH